MALRILLPGSTNWGSTGSWADNTVPIDGDDVAIYEGSQVVSAGLNQSSINLASLFVGPDFHGSIGSASAPLQINVDSASDSVLTWSGRGGYCKIAGTVNNAKVNGAGRFYAAGGTWLKTDVAGQAMVEFDSSASISTRVSLTSGNASVLIPEYSGGGGATVPALWVTAGVARVARQIVNGYLGAGERGKGVLYAVDDASVSTALMLLGGEAWWRASGAVALLNGFAGRFTGEGNPYGDVTVTNAVLAEALRIQTKWSGGEIVFTNAPDYAGSPAGLIVD